ESRPVTSATQALQGIVPGLQITTNTGEMDKDMKPLFISRYPQNQHGDVIRWLKAIPNPLQRLPLQPLQ
ncbi:hypothetical protein, partial [Bacteroides sp. 51]|uniref:hypothetical protein n=1 Tax=Bacteroides sp. 51 TaxID=2302938 RepID=UPI0019402E1E